MYNYSVGAGHTSGFVLVTNEMSTEHCRFGRRPQPPLNHAKTRQYVIVVSVVKRKVCFIGVELFYLIECCSAIKKVLKVHRPPSCRVLF